MSLTADFRFLCGCGTFRLSLDLHRQHIPPEHQVRSFMWALWGMPGFNLFDRLKQPEGT